MESPEIIAGGGRNASSFDGPGTAVLELVANAIRNWSASPPIFKKMQDTWQEDNK